MTTQIIIQYSAGLQVETEPPEETTPPVTITVSFDVPERKVEYMLEVRRKGEDTVLASKQVPPGQTSTYVELTAAHMKTLAVGTHTLSVYFTGDTATTTFTISKDATKNPTTGANDFVGVAAALAVVSLLGMAVASRKK